ncbi:ATP-dependent DNA ligase [Psychrobacillus phage Perkons]|nr:ATP-dependent DNA ligase [Psychrobacillus phage Perkons]
MTNIKMLYDISQELKNTSGKLDKLSILKRENENDLWKKFVKFVYDPLLMYGIKDKKLKKHKGKVGNIIPFQNIFECFEYLLTHSTGRDEDVKLVQAYIESENEQYHEFLTESICKTLKLGVDSTINKAYGKGFIYEFSPMLAHPFEKYADKVKNKKMYFTEKLDGLRSLWFVENGKVTGYSRSGKELIGYEHIESELSTFEDSVYDGELLIDSADNFKDRDVMQQTNSIASSKGDKSQLTLHLYDVIDIEGFKNGKSRDVYSKRRETLDSLNTTSLNSVRVLPVIYIGNDMEIVGELLTGLEDEGKEGMMANVSNGFYTDTRSSSILKLKTFKTFDDFCLDVYEGEGKYKGMLGGIIVNYKGYQLGCGSGFNDSDREYYWKYKDEIVGQLVEVKYFRESKDKDGNLSVSFPIFKTIRHDKSEPSYN